MKLWVAINDQDLIQIYQSTSICDANYFNFKKSFLKFGFK